MTYTSRRHQAVDRVFNHKPVVALTQLHGTMSASLFPDALALTTRTVRTVSYKVAHRTDPANEPLYVLLNTTRYAS